MTPPKTFKNFTAYWDWAKTLTDEDRRQYVKSLPVASRRRLERDFNEGWSRYFQVACDIKELDDYYKWADDKPTEERVKLLYTMAPEKKRALIRECSQRRRIRKEMKTPKYEFRFQNGDVFFSDKRDTQLSATANIVIDHEKGTVEKNRYGQNGHQAYNQLFPNAEYKHSNQLNFAINTSVTIVENGDDLDVLANGKLVRTIKSDGNSQFDIWRLLSALSRVK